MATVGHTHEREGIWHKIMSHLKNSEKEVDTTGLKTETRFDNLLTKQHAIIHYIHSLIREKDPDKAIQNILNELLGFLNVDHVCIIEYDMPQGVTNCTYEAMKENVPGIKESCCALPVSQFTWWTEQIKKDIPMVFSRLDDMSKEGALALRKMKEQGVKSIMVVPFISKDESLGYICADTIHAYRDWNDDDYQWFFTFSNVISIYIELRIRDAHRKMINYQVRQFEEIFKLIADYAKVGYAHYNAITKQGYAADSWYYNVGATPDMSLHDLLNDMTYIHPDDKQTLQQFARKAILGEADNLRAHIRIMRPDGSVTWSCFNCLVRDFKPEEGIVEVVSINYDITDQKQLEKRLIEARNDAEASDKLKSAFLANMSHEIRTPLNAIIGFSDLLVHCDVPEERVQYVDVVKKNSDILLHLVTDILDISQIESGGMTFKFKEVEARSVCSGIIDSFHWKTSGNVPILLEEGLPKCYFQTDTLRITQVITNFINNAMKFTEHGSITLGYEQLSPDELKFYVRDTGIGIPADQVNTVFERFVKLNSFLPGTGLGLSICQRIVEQLHGKIGVESQVGKGSCFWFTHPIAQEETPK